MYEETIDDETLFRELKSEMRLSPEIRRYIRNADEQLSPKKKLLDIPQQVVRGKLNSRNDGKIRNLLKKMQEFEWILTATGDKYRANSIHQIRVFLLGYLLLYKCGIKDHIESLLDRSPKTQACDFEIGRLDFVWLYASLFHDIGYLIEKLSEIQDKIHNWTMDFGLFQTTCAISIIENDSESITDTLNKLSDCSPVWERWLNEGYRKRDHGIISALITRNEFGNNWRDPFIIPGIRAMAIHNLKKQSICFEENPIAFLLMLCDEMQEWDRPSRMWGHYQLINPIKCFHLTADSNGNSKVRLNILYDFSNEEIIRELSDYEEEFECLDRDIISPDGKLNIWSEDEFLKVKCHDLNSKLTCGDKFDVAFQVIRRDHTLLTLQSFPDKWEIKK